MKNNVHNRPRINNLKGGLALTIALFLGGCGLPLSDTTIDKIIKGLAADNASACITLGAGGGGGAVFPAPAIPVGGGYASLVACRSNEPGSIIIVKANGDLEIHHGMFKIPVEEKELKELRERLKKFEDVPTVFFVPRPPNQF